MCIIHMENLVLMNLQTQTSNRKRWRAPTFGFFITHGCHYILTQYTLLKEMEMPLISTF